MPQALSALLRLHASLLSDHRIAVGDAGVEIVRGAGTSLALVLLDSALRLAYSAELSRAQDLPEL